MALNQIYFFKKDGQCSWMTREINESMIKFLTAPVDYEGKQVIFYLILDWISSKTRGANTQALDEGGINYVQSVSELPEGGGVYITGYDSDIQTLEELKKKNVPLIERPCPWVRQLRNQLERMNKDTHQCVMMIDPEHMVFECYRSIIPDDVIVVSNENFKTQLKKHRNQKPIDLKVYATFRKKDAERLVAYINETYPHPDNLLNGYKKTLCNWSSQGLIEEISSQCQNRNLNEIWIICSSEGDRSTISIINEILENNAKPIIIKKHADVPDEIAADARVGVLFAPIPLSSKTRSIKELITQRFNH